MVKHKKVSKYFEQDCSFKTKPPLENMKIIVILKLSEELHETPIKKDDWSDYVTVNDKWIYQNNVKV